MFFDFDTLVVGCNIEKSDADKFKKKSFGWLTRISHSPYNISSLAKSSGSGMLRPFSTVESIVLVIEETDEISDFGGANQPHPPSSLRL
jgi:hypothetical protein